MSTTSFAPQDATSSGAVPAASNALLERVWHTAATHPEAPAFRMLGQDPVSYGQLWRLSSAVADYLQGNEGVPTIVVGGKSALTVAAFLGCLRSGHAYVPVDPSMPASRVRSMTEQIQAACGGAPQALLCSSDDQARAAGHDPVVLVSVPALVAQATAPDASAHADAPSISPDERAAWVSGEQTQYVIFTSGSTGAPKGIEVTEADVRNFMGWLDGFPIIREGGRTFLDQAPYSFDLSEYELVGALSTGGCLFALSPEATHDFKLLYQELGGSGVDVWVSTPPFANLCLADRSFCARLLPRVGLFLLCGDTLTHRTAAELRRRFPQARVANTYGPTESTVAITYCEIDDAMLASDDPLPVGFARPGTELHVMRQAGSAQVDPDAPLTQECPAGESGEIVIVGDTVAKGYLGDPAKTQAAFGEGTLADGRRVRTFRTGDIGHLGPDGMLHYEGRMGSLVKLNGFRIELGDVENHLCELGGIKMAAVVAQRRQGRVSALKAFVMLDHDTPGEDETPRALKQRLAQQIPSYMVPRTIKVLESMPLTANGKIDRKLLAAG